MRLARLSLPLLLAACTGQDKPGGDPSHGDAGTDSGTTDGGATDTDTDTDADTDAGGDGGDTGGGDTGETVVPPPVPWLRDAEESPGPITFTELHYHPAAEGDGEWLELHNPMVMDVDLSGWSLQGGVEWTFPEGTILAAGGYLVVAADPAALADETGVADALGPYDGRLSNGGERVSLVSNSGRRIDTLEYADDAPWPVGPDGSGFSLAKITPTGWSDRAEGWTVSRQVGGTPGAENGLDPVAPPVVEVLVPADATWRYDLSDSWHGTDWTAPGYDDGAWESGTAPFYAGGPEGDLPATAWVTADNYWAMYVGAADGSDLRYVAADSDGDWTTVEAVDLDVAPTDHLYLAAWELTGDSTSPQMVIGEVEVDGTLAGTDADTWEWVLGPSFDNPGELPAAAAPDEADVAWWVEAATADDAWLLPEAETGRTSSPWGSRVGGSFTDVAAFIWGDTFDYDSVTNSEDTWALFRTRDPVVAPWGSVELSSIPTVVPFRTDFSFDATAGSTTLVLECTLDDGAVVSLNGVEVLRENMPDGPVDETTLAWTETEDGVEVRAELSADALVTGDNVLAVSLHQAADPDADLRFGCALTAETTSEPPAPTVTFDEVGPAGGTLWVDLRNVGAASADLDGMVLSTSAGDRVLLDPAVLGAGELLGLDALPLPAEEGDRLFLTSADGSTLLDAVRLSTGPRARISPGGPWGVPVAGTPGADNDLDLVDDIVINELMYHRAPVSEEGEPFAERDEEWLELYNRGEVEVDLSGWQLVDAVAFELPEGTVLAPGDFLVIAADADAVRADHPDAEVIGDYVGRLSNSTDRVLLLDARGNPADEVRYHDGGRWPGAADGGGSSLELRDPWADNAVAEAWAASDEADRAAWQTYRWRGVAEDSEVGPDGVWEELVIGLLDAGEVLIDDVSVVADPDTAPVELLQEGDFSQDAARWRLLGTHRHSEVVPDPDDAGNPVLRLVATGPTGHMHNHAETTLLQPITEREYEISLRARWVSGSNQLHGRLYFNRLPNTTLVAQPAVSGTPGAENSIRVDNLGPTLTTLAQDVAIPAPCEPVVVSVTADDPDGVAAVDLWAAVDGGDFSATAMDEVAPGRWEAELPGQDAGTQVQLYVEASDALGAAATLPAGGPDSRALYVVDDGREDQTGLHDLRILMTAADTDRLHEDTELMSNDRLGATVIYNRSEVFHDVGVRLKGSQRGRPTSARLGYALRFPDDQPFRGSHTSVMIDRSEGVGYGQREVLINLVMTAAGSVSGEHNDLIHLVAPRSTYDGAAELQLDRFSSLVLDAQFEDGSDGGRFEYELVYYPTTTDDGTAEGYKLPQPDSVTGTTLTDLGDDPEQYRHVFLIKNNERADDYTGVMELSRTMGLSTDDLLAVAPDVIDVDQWLRAFAFSTLSGATDQYGGAGSLHNAQFYQRPGDGRWLFFPHDLDYFSSSTMPVVGNSDLAQLIEDPVYERMYYGHLADVLGSVYDTAYLGPWCDQLATLLPAQDFDSHCAFVDARAAWLWEGASDSVLSTFPAVDFAITTGGGEDLSVTAETVTLEGRAWVDVREILRDGVALDVDWIDGSTWQVRLPLDEGDNTIELVAVDRYGDSVGSDSITVTRE